MAKFPKPYFRSQRGTWCVQLDGKQITLGTEREESFRQYHRLMADRQKPAAPPPAGLAVVSVIELFLDWCQKNKAARTYDWYWTYLQSFASFGTDGWRAQDLGVSDLKPFHVQQWVDSKPGWKTGKRGAIVAVQRSLNWAARQGHIAVNLIRNMEKPPPRRREQLITPEEYSRILGVVKDDAFRWLLELYWATGARPHELFAVEARFVDLPNGRWVFPVRESKGKKYQRVVYLNDRALEITRLAMVKNPDGPMLRNTDGVSWSMASVNCRMQRIRNKLGVKYSLYAIRHSFCTFALAGGKLDAVTVSHLMGHRTTDMVSRHYAHLTQLVDHLRQAAKRVRAAGA